MERKKEFSIAYKVAILIIIAVLGFLYAQSRRYTYFDKGIRRVDSWTGKMYRYNIDTAEWQEVKR
ncbi:MAG: hypothetical protein Q4D56_06530 [Bacteroides sp.]|nr:hypothetical protein [Bacteroides sp.]